MNLSELFLNRYLYKDNNQSSETQDSAFSSLDSSDTEPASIPSGGAAQDINTGNVQIDGGQLEPGTYPTTTLDVSNWGWGQTCAFSSDDNNTVSWAGGTFTSASGEDYTIGVGDTGNMGVAPEITYIYLDLNVSEIAYQTTTTSADSVGIGKVLIAVAKIGLTGADDATYNLSEATQIIGDNILANTIDASKMNVGQLSAISANIGDITAGTITGLTITGGTIRTAASGTRLQMTNATQRMDGINANGDVVSSLNWSSTSIAVLKLAPTYDARRALEIAIPASFAGVGAEADAKAITIDNAADSISIDITDGGLVGLQIAGCDTSAINVTNAPTNGPGIDLTYTGSSYPNIDIEQNGASTNSYGIRIVQGTAAAKEGIYIDDNASSHLSESIFIDRDSNSTSDAAAIKINSDNAGTGESIGIDFSGSSSQRVIKVAADTGGIGTIAGRITIMVGGSTKFIPYYDAP